ncbi:hypothetical protein BGX38DRAFT_921708 [Terfezia claveryi]|nr:hypothetical protein BGX38DRAFT_921708 [Terfezia claveryi]
MLLYIYLFIGIFFISFFFLDGYVRLPIYFLTILCFLLSEWMMYGIVVVAARVDRNSCLVRRHSVQLGVVIYSCDQLGGGGRLW